MASPYRASNLFFEGCSNRTTRACHTSANIFYRGLPSRSDCQAFGCSGKSATFVYYSTYYSLLGKHLSLDFTFIEGYISSLAPGTALITVVERHKSLQHSENLSWQCFKEFAKRKSSEAHQTGADWLCHRFLDFKRPTLSGTLSPTAFSEGCTPNLPQKPTCPFGAMFQDTDP